MLLGSASLPGRHSSGLRASFLRSIVGSAGTRQPAARRSQACRRAQCPASAPPTACLACLLGRGVFCRPVYHPPPYPPYPGPGFLKNRWEMLR